MIVVADTSPLNYLVLVGQIEILSKIYAEVLIPQAVLDELQDSFGTVVEGPSSRYASMLSAMV